MPAPIPPSPRPLLRRLARGVALHRRLVSAALVALAVAFAVSAMAPPRPATEPVLVAVRDLAGGAQLSASDVEVRAVPPDLVPSEVRRPGDRVTGRLTASAVTRGEILTEARLLGPSLLAGFPAGTVATPVRIADATSLQIVRSGDRVDVLAAEERSAGPAPAALVAAAVAVLAVPPPEETAGAGSGGLVVLATSADQAAALAGAQAAADLSIVLRAG